MVFTFLKTCVVHAPAAIWGMEGARALSMLEVVIDLGKLSAVQFILKCLIRLTFKDPVDKNGLLEQGSLVFDGIEFSVANSDRLNTLLYVYHYPTEGDDERLADKFRQLEKII